MKKKLRSLSTVAVPRLVRCSSFLLLVPGMSFGELDEGINLAGQSKAVIPVLGGQVFRQDMREIVTQPVKLSLPPEGPVETSDMGAEILESGQVRLIDGVSVSLVGPLDTEQPTAEEANEAAPAVTYLATAGKPVGGESPGNSEKPADTRAGYGKPETFIQKVAHNGDLILWGFIGAVVGCVIANVLLAVWDHRNEFLVSSTNAHIHR